MPWTWIAVQAAGWAFGLWLMRRHFREVPARNAQLRWKLDERRGL
jgi:ABC-type glycerol-3-phosphate transport system permease component